MCELSQFWDLKNKIKSGKCIIVYLMDGFGSNLKKVVPCLEEVSTAKLASFNQGRYVYMCEIGFCMIHICNRALTSAVNGIT